MKALLRNFTSNLWAKEATECRKRKIKKYQCPVVLYSPGTC